MGKRHELIGDIRGKGMMLAIELVKDKKTKEPAVEETKRILEAGRNRGLLLLKAGLYGNVVRFHPPITIEEELLSKGLDIVDDLLDEVASGRN